MVGSHWIATYWGWHFVHPELFLELLCNHYFVSATSHSAEFVFCIISNASAVCSKCSALRETSVKTAFIVSLYQRLQHHA